MRSRLVAASLLSLTLLGCQDAPTAARASAPEAAPAGRGKPDPVVRAAAASVEEGRRVFRFDTFGDEAWWTGVLRLNEPLAGVSPRTALSVGLKVDVDALPSHLASELRSGRVDLDDPGVTLALLAADAVVGVKAVVEGGSLRSIGVTCAACHSTVDDALAPGVGHRLDGWPNQDLNVGAIVGLSPNLQAIADLLGKGGAAVDVPTVQKVLASWGPGKYDAELNLDAKAFRPDGKTGAVLIPPAFGLAGVNLHTWTGWGSVTYWNALVANLEMHGQGLSLIPA